MNNDIFVHANRLAEENARLSKRVEQLEAAASLDRVKMLEVDVLALKYPPTLEDYVAMLANTSTRCFVRKDDINVVNMPSANPRSLPFVVLSNEAVWGWTLAVDCSRSACQLVAAAPDTLKTGFRPAGDKSPEHWAYLPKGYMFAFMRTPLSYSEQGPSCWHLVGEKKVAT